MLVTSNIPVRQENGGRRSIRRLPSPARVTGYAVLETTKSWNLESLGNYKVLETAKPWKLRSLGNYEALDTSISSAVMPDILIHGAILQMRSCDEISVSDGLRFAKPHRNPHPYLCTSAS